MGGGHNFFGWSEGGGNVFTGSKGGPNFSIRKNNDWLILHLLIKANGRVLKGGTRIFFILSEGGPDFFFTFIRGDRFSYHG